MDYELLDEKDVPDNVIIPDEGWAIKIGTSIIAINEMRFADEPNEDGSFGVNIDYEVLDGLLLPREIDTIGPICMEILEESIKIKEMRKLMDEARKEKK